MESVIGVEWHASQVVEPQPDGSLILRLHVNDLRLTNQMRDRWMLGICTQSLD